MIEVAGRKFVRSEQNWREVELRDKVVLLSGEGVLPEFEAESFRVVKVNGGFGASPGKMGSALFVEYLFDGEPSREDRNFVECLLEEVQ